jgi:hypothetical protein
MRALYNVIAGQSLERLAALSDGLCMGVQCTAHACESPVLRGMWK